MNIKLIIIYFQMKSIPDTVMLIKSKSIMKRDCWSIKNMTDGQYGKFRV